MTNLELVVVSGDIPEDGHCYHIVDRDVKDHTWIVASFLTEADAELFLKAKRASAEPGGDAPYEVRDNEEGIAAVYLQGKRVDLPVFTPVISPSAVCGAIGCHSGEIHTHAVGSAVPAVNREAPL